MRKKGKSEISVIQRKIWEHCKRITRSQYPNTCYTCGKTGLSGSNWHTGHMWPKAALGAFLKYDLRILRPQCYHCNINLGGNGAVFYAKMMQEIGRVLLGKLERDRQVTVKALDHYQKILKEYEKIK